MLAILFFVFLGTLILGVPIAIAMGYGAVCAFMLEMPRAMVMMPTKMFGGLDSFSLMAIPFFILAGDIMSASGISRKLINFAELLVGWIKGGLALATVTACVIFASVCGSAAASTSAIGAVMINSMAEKGYEKGFVSCLVASGGCIGPIIPPSILAVIYAGATGLSVGALFMAGVLPGLVLAAALAVCCVVYARKNPEIAKAVYHVSFAEGKSIVFDALPALFMPVIIIGGILTGIVTATEAGGIACIYGILIGFAQRTLSIKVLWDVFANSALTVSRLMIIVGIATIFGWVLSIKRFPNTVADFLTSVSSNPYVVIFLIILFLIFIGFFMETVAALIILTPVLAPIGEMLGFDPLQYAMILFTTLLFGAITPPVGILLFITSNIANIRLTESLKFIWPFVFAFLFSIAVLVFCPFMSKAIPNFLGL